MFGRCLVLQNRTLSTVNKPSSYVRIASFVVKGECLSNISHDIDVVLGFNWFVPFHRNRCSGPASVGWGLRFQRTAFGELFTPCRQVFNRANGNWLQSTYSALLQIVRRALQCISIALHERPSTGDWQIWDGVAAIDNQSSWIVSAAHSAFGCRIDKPSLKIFDLFVRYQQAIFKRFTLIQMKEFERCLKLSRQVFYDLWGLEFHYRLPMYSKHDSSAWRWNDFSVGCRDAGSRYSD